MIHGINFGCGEIPEGFARRFRKVWREVPRGIAYRLVGVATDRQSLSTALIQADNGRRKLHVEERKTAAGICYGIYAY